MGIWCVACTNSDKNSLAGISFHKFPLQNQDLLRKWILPIRRKFVPTQYHRLCSEHFTESCYWKSNNRLLKDDAVPTIFDFPCHLKKTENPPLKLLIKEMEAKELDAVINTKKNDKISSLIAEEHNYSLNDNEALKKLKIEHDRKDALIASLSSRLAKYKQRCGKRDYTRRKLKSALTDLKEKTLINEHTLQVLNSNQSDIMLDIISASGEHNAEYSDNFKRFASLMYYYSPVAYEYIRANLSKGLPHPNVVQKWKLPWTESSSVTEGHHCR